jgi:hypothetical protein
MVAHNGLQIADFTCAHSASPTLVCTATTDVVKNLVSGTFRLRLGLGTTGDLDVTGGALTDSILETAIATSLVSGVRRANSTRKCLAPRAFSLPATLDGSCTVHSLRCLTQLPLLLGPTLLGNSRAFSNELYPMSRVRSPAPGASQRGEQCCGHTW